MPDRRGFLGTVAAGALPQMEHDTPAPSPPWVGLIPREIQPPNLETHPLQLRDEITRIDAFYIRNHFPTPRIDPKTWRLSIEGAIDKKQTFTLGDIKQLPSVVRPMTMECAGNGRVFLTPKVRGVNWAYGAVGHAEWKGVTLDTVLKLAGLQPSATDVIFEGADVGTINDDPKSPGPIAYARSVPIQKARQPEVILAYEMNGQPLTADHGWPLRVVVGGWYGMANVKWLTRIIVSDQPFQGFWQTMDYSEFVRVNGVPTLQPITAMRVKAIVLTPLGPDRPTTIGGVAWAGEHAVAKVEISTDNGKSWQPATLNGKPMPLEWIHWHCANVQFGTGPTTVMARATDSAGTTQPMDRDADRRTYQINHVIPTESGGR